MAEQAPVGAAGYGTIFSIDPGTKILTTLYSFQGGLGAAALHAPLSAVGKTLYGVSGGGGANLGEVFRLVP